MKRQKKLSRAERTLLQKINKGFMPGVGENHIADKLLGRGLVKFNMATNPRYVTTDEGREECERNDDVQT